MDVSDDNPVALCRFRPDIQGELLSAGIDHRLGKEGGMEYRIFLFQLFEDIRCVVGRGIIYDDDFVGRVARQGQEGRKILCQCCLLVVNDYHDRQLYVCILRSIV